MLGRARRLLVTRGQRDGDREEALHVGVIPRGARSRACVPADRAAKPGASTPSASRRAGNVVWCDAMSSRPPEQPETTLARIMEERRGKARALRDAGSDPFRNDLGPAISLAEGRDRHPATRPP